MLQTDSLPESQKFLGPALWLYETVQMAGARPVAQVRNLMLAQIVKVPSEGYLHPRSGMLGVLFDSLKDGKTHAQIRAAFGTMTDSRNYQRPKAPPKEGAIDRAERLVAELGLAPALKRRFARLDEVKKIWQPKPLPATPSPGGVFESLRSLKKVSMPTDEHVINITWVKFRDTVLPTALSIETRIERALWGIGLLTALHPDAPPLLKWDRPKCRNPVSWYLHDKPSHPSAWNLTAGQTAEVTAVVPLPTLWNEPKMSTIGNGVVLVLDGCRDLGKPSTALFPVFMRQELHAVRAVIAAHSNKDTPSGVEEASACGLPLFDGGCPQQIVLHVTTDLGVTRYKIFRWD